MENENGTTPSIRDTIANAVETHIPETPVTTETSVQQVAENVKTDRARDEQGRFAKTEQEKQEEKAVSVTERLRPQRPSSWKKEYWGHFDKLTTGQPLTPEEALQVAEYASQREQEFAKGVSTYKAEWDRVKPFMDAINPIAPILQQNGLDANRFINDAANIYRAFTTGTPQQKIGTLFQLAQMYQVPLEEVFDQTEDGQWVLNPSKIQMPAQQARQPQAPDVRNVVKEILMEEDAARQVKSFADQVDKYPHVEQVRETMAGLLRAGLVEDLQNAYQAALRMPQHAELFESIQRQQRETEDKRKAEEAAKLAQGARLKTVSPRSSTPAGPVKTEKGKGTRSIIEDAVNERLGRV